MNWIKVTVYTNSENIDMLCDVIYDNGIKGVEIQDPSDIDVVLSAPGWDYVDNELLNKKESIPKVCAYLPETPSGRDTLSALIAAINARFPDLKLETESVRDEDWETSWKKYFKPIEVSNRIAIKPRWEEYSPKAGQRVIDIDPGMAFGTGTHETTRLCLLLIDKYIKTDDKVLDIGCGSGILSIGALLLGAHSCAGCDISEVAVEAATENARHNAVQEKAAFFTGDLKCVKERGFDLVCANIVADVLISISPDVVKFINRGGVYIISGIIEERAAEVIDAVKNAGFSLLETMEENGWCAAAFKYL